MINDGRSLLDVDLVPEDLLEKDGRKPLDFGFHCVDDFLKIGYNRPTIFSSQALGFLVKSSSLFCIQL